jgi:energy-coupling factor transporter ATP-binding protein EcfA2
MSPKVKQRERTAIVKALQAGVVPRIGLQHLQVGRRGEIEAVLSDLKHVADGGSAVRFIIGRYGSGKTFFLNLMRTLAHENDFVVADCDITMRRRLYSSQGDARALYAELMKNASTKSKPQGGALESIVERWIGDIHHRVTQEGGDKEEVKAEIMESLESLRDYVGGYDFATVLAKYYEGFHDADAELQQNAIRWLRGEFSTKTEARKALGVRTIVDDDNIYDHLKLFAAFVKIAGYSGLMLGLDEMKVLSHNISHPKSREGNFEVILQIVNECLQGDAEGLQFLMAGIPGFLEDPKRGLHSYGALKTRLAENKFAVEGVSDFSGPVIRLQNLSEEDLYVLLNNIRDVFARRDPDNYLISDEGIQEFMRYCAEQIGSDYFRTPRDSVKEFVGLLSVLEQNPDTTWRELLPNQDETVDSPEAESAPSDGETAGDELTSFEL